MGLCILLFIVIGYLSRLFILKVIIIILCFSNSSNSSHNNHNNHNINNNSNNNNNNNNNLVNSRDTTCSKVSNKYRLNKRKRLLAEGLPLADIYIHL